MHLILRPQIGLPGQPEITIHVAGDVLTVDGTPYDLSHVPEGGEEWPEAGPFAGPVTRQNGTLRVHLSARLGDDAAPNQGGPWVVPNAAGEVTIPAARIEQEAK